MELQISSGQGPVDKLVSEQNAAGRRMTDRNNWLEHTRLIRGNAVRIYEGLDFRRVK